MPTSPYINRFLSADTVVPNMANPQAFNRYSYAYNNPLRYIDPSGHASVCGFSYSDPECPPAAPVKPIIPPGGSAGGNKNNNGGNSCSGPNPSLVCLPTPTPQPQLPPLVSPSVEDDESPAPNPITPDFVQDAGELFEDTFKLLYVLSENGRYPYKLLRSFSVNPVGEALVSGGLQFIGDLDNQLDPRQRFLRVLWASTEAALIDGATVPFIYATTVAGIVSGAFVDGPLPIGEAAGGIVTYAVSSLAYNAGAVALSETYLTPIIYSKLDLYDPYGN